MSSWFSSKPATPAPAPLKAQAPSFAPDYSNAQFSASELQRQLSVATTKAQEAAKKSFDDAQEAGKKALAATQGSYKFFFYILGFIILVLLGMVLYDAFAPASWPNLLFNKDSKGLTAPATTPTTKSVGSTDAPEPPYFQKLYHKVFGNSSGNLAPKFHDATQEATIKSTEAPLSAQREGGYGMQWWMYVKDWNYGYGKKKTVVKRPEPTNSRIMNPEISLHPTDNSLQISVSIYPNKDGSSGKSEPAAAGHSGSTDDVFVCDVPNIPLQTWFSVSVTVFGRNLDVYIDGKLVKSCFLTGVPKPAVGDIQLTPDGGFSGRICDFYHYPKMLTPADTMTFWSAGTPCRNMTETGGSLGTTATGYSVKFGVYDTLGKEVQEYTF